MVKKSLLQRRAQTVEGNSVPPRPLSLFSPTYRDTYVYANVSSRVCTERRECMWQCRVLWPTPLSECVFVLIFFCLQTSNNPLTLLCYRYETLFLDQRLGDRTKNKVVPVRTSCAVRGPMLLKAASYTEGGVSVKTWLPTSKLKKKQKKRNSLSHTKVHRESQQF